MGGRAGRVNRADLDAFAAALPGGGRLMGLDVGTRTIGVALADAGWSVASPWGVVARRRLAADLAELRALAAAQQVAGLVIGHPLNMDGSAGPRAQATRAFAREARALGLPILLFDERLSTAEAERAMLAADLSRAKRARRIDAHAAAIILQGAIDALAGLDLPDRPATARPCAAP
jgi:putative Holliday junction resolvase